MTELILALTWFFLLTCGHILHWYFLPVTDPDPEPFWPADITCIGNTSIIMQSDILACNIRTVLYLLASYSFWRLLAAARPAWNLIPPLAATTKTTDCGCGGRRWQRRPPRLRPNHSQLLKTKADETRKPGEWNSNCCLRDHQCLEINVVYVNHSCTRPMTQLTAIKSTIKFVK